MATGAAVRPFPAGTGFVHGVTYAGAAEDGSLEADLEVIAGLGANAIRNWGGGEETRAMLDAAHRHGLKVVLGIWMRHGRAGAEGVDNFNYLTDEAGMEAQYASAVAAVKAYHDHPALLAWGIGNEVVLNTATDAGKEAYAKFLERVVQAAKVIDPVHPVGSVSAWSIAWPWWEKFTPSLDFYGINTYGYGAAAVPSERTRLGVTKPYLVTEFGASGEWEAPVGAHGVKIEPDDAHKYAIISPGFHDLLEAHRGTDGCLGGFVFHYGSGKMDHTSMWLGLRIEGKNRPSYWATREAFTGQPPLDYPPVISSFLVRGSAKALPAGTWVAMRVDYEDAENAPCQVTFAGNLREQPWPAKDTIEKLESRPTDTPGVFEVRLPDRAGAWKLYALVSDPYPNQASATTAVLVQ